MITNPYDQHPNAQKWTAETVMTHLTNIEKEATEGESMFLGMALFKEGLYRHVWGYWKRTFHQNEDIIERMLRIESGFEARLLDGALKKKLSPYIAYLTLKNNYNWDKPAVIASKPLLHKSNN